MIKKEDLTKNLSEWNEVVLDRIPKQFIAINDTIAEATGLILEEANTYTGNSYRKPPLVISRLARGGKTTVLSKVFLALKEMGLPSLFVSFGADKLKRRKNETVSETILRQIALQLMNPIPLQESVNIVCNEQIIEEKIQQAIEETKLPFVLLIDELNQLGAPLDFEAFELLKRLFLDPFNRYLVFSSNVPLNLDHTVNELCEVIKSSSKRGVRTVKLPFTTSVSELNSMFAHAKSLPLAHVLLYHGLPSLIFSVEDGNFDPVDRVHDDFTEMTDKFKMVTVASPERFRQFISQVVDGTEFKPSDPVMKLLQSFSVPQSKGLTRFPLCYIPAIIDELAPFDSSVISRIKRIIVEDLPMATRSVESRVAFEYIVELAILLQALKSQLRSTDHPLSNGNQVSQAESLPLPTEFTKVDDELHEHIKKTMDEFKETTLVIFRPTNSGFCTLDGILAYKTPTNILKITGYQVKANNKGPSQTSLPPWISKAYLIRGNPPNKSKNDKTKPVKWDYMVRKDIEGLLGYSLTPLLDAFSSNPTQRKRKKVESSASNSEDSKPH
jgi:hypothetical protein